MKLRTFTSLVIGAHTLLFAAGLTVMVKSWLQTQPDDRWRITCSIIVGIAIGFQLSDIVLSRRFRKLQRDTDARYDQLLASVEKERQELHAQLTGRHASH